MAKTRNSNYRSSAAVDFYFAPVGGEQFARVDISVVAKALDDHDHSAGLGLAVTRIGANSVGTSALVDLAVTGPKIAVATIPGSKLINNTITDTQLDSPRAYRGGDIFTGLIGVQAAGVNSALNTLYANAHIQLLETNPEPGGGVHNVAAIGFGRNAVEGAGLYYYSGDFYYRSATGVIGKLYSTVNFSPPGAFVIGMILFWNQAASIPTGWTELTADRGRTFVAANGTSGTNPSGVAFTFDATGGSDTHTHVMSNHSHGMDHNHTFTTGTNNSNESGLQNGGAAVAADDPHTHGGTSNGPSNGSTNDGIGGTPTQATSTFQPYRAKTAMVYTG